MTKRIVVPTDDENMLDSIVAQHFGRAPYFAIVELNQNGQITNNKIITNTGEHVGGTGHPHENLLTISPDVIIAHAMGPGGLSTFQNAGITVLKAEGRTVKDVIANFKENKLKELLGGCEHAHEHHHSH